MLTKFLQLISIIFEPFLTAFLALAVVINSAGLGWEQNRVWLLVAVLLGGLPPLGVLIYEKKRGLISDWFIVKREERRDVELAWAFGSLMLVAIVYFFHGPKVLLALSLDLFILGCLFTLINQVWKISVHAAFITLLVVCLLLFGSLEFYPALVLIPLVAYSRWYLHKHTLTQLTSGAFLALLVTYGIFVAFGLLGL